MGKLWSGRFQEKGDSWLDEFGASISFDYQLAEEDIEGSLAHVAMLEKCEIISSDEHASITQGLHAILKKIHEGTFHFALEHEDIHLNIEKALHDDIGAVAGKLHTARSRNDQVATDMHLYLKKQVNMLIQKIELFQKVLVTTAEKHVDTLMPGYTHLQHAQPISFAHHLMAYYEMLTRDKARFTESLSRIDISPLGCAALAGTTFPIDRHYTAELLGFSRLYQNSLDGVSDRDFIVEFLSDSSLLMMHLSRFCEEIILWSSHEFKFIELSDKFSTGSSIMPQKKNPDYAELVRGKTGRVYGNLFGMLTVLKGTPLAYNKDLQEDKEGMFDTVKTLRLSLDAMVGMIETMTVNHSVMAVATEKDFSNATELADYLASKGMPFREAHEVVGKLVYSCIERQIYLQDISLPEYQETSTLIEEDIYQTLSSKTAMNRRNSVGGTGVAQVTEAITKAKIALAITE